jgi:hypothetical protein
MSARGLSGWAEPLPPALFRPRAGILRLRSSHYLVHASANFGFGPLEPEKTGHPGQSLGNQQCFSG